MNYLENLRILRQAVQDEPDDQFSLRDFARETPCGTLHCTAGLATTLPHFQKLGLYLYEDIWGSAAPRIDSLEQDRRFMLDTTLNHLFKPFPDAEMLEDDGAFDYLFNTFGDGKWDGELYRDGDASHKELALARLDKAITLWEASE